MSQIPSGPESPKAPVARTESVGSLDFHPKEEHRKSKSSLKASANNLIMDDSGQVKFTKESPSKGDESTVEIGDVTQTFSGMGKEELMKYANDPFWIRLRWFLFVLFWIGWLGMLAAAIAIIVVAPKCPAPAELEYWQKSPIYEVLPRSYQSSVPEDDVGDLKGLTSRLDHLVELGAKVLMLSSIFKSKSAVPNEGYDTVSFTDVDPLYGSMEDFKALIEAAKSKDLKVLLDYVPNHSSEEHPWFKNSIDKTDPYTDYYVWKSGDPTTPPNNWLSVTGGSAWTYNEKRGEWYLHQFGSGRPDFNFHNEAVRKQLLEDTLLHWLEMGVHGFRVRAIPYLYEDDQFRNEPPKNSRAGPNDYSSLEHTRTLGQNQSFEALHKMREVLDQFVAPDGLPRILVTDAEASLEDVSNFYGTENQTRANLHLNYQLGNLQSGFSAVQLNESVNSVRSDVPAGAWSSWGLSNSRQSRLASRLGSGSSEVLALVQFLLPGTPIVYYGDEIAMEDSGVDSNTSMSFDPACQPMAWDQLAGQKADPYSPWSIYKSLTALRKENSIMHGTTSILIVDDDIFSFTRVRKGSPGYLVVVNVGNNVRHVSFEEQQELPAELAVVIRTSNSTADGSSDVMKSNITVNAHEGLVLSFVPVKL